jgi:hypothetical protein
MRSYRILIELLARLQMAPIGKGRVGKGPAAATPFPLLDLESRDAISSPHEPTISRVLPFSTYDFLSVLCREYLTIIGFAVPSACTLTIISGGYSAVGLFGKPGHDRNPYLIPDPVTTHEIHPAFRQSRLEAIDRAEVVVSRRQANEIIVPPCLRKLRAVVVRRLHFGVHGYRAAEGWTAPRSTSNKKS